MWQIPTLAENSERVRQAFRANLKGSDAWLWPNNVFVASKVIAGAVQPIYDFMEYIARQRFAHLAEGRWLEEHAKQYSMARLAPTYAEGRVTLAGDAGIVVPSGLTLARSDGILYETLTGGTIASSGDGSGGTLDVTVRATTTGRAGNALYGQPLTLQAALDSVASEAHVASDGIGGGADVESDESLRTRVLHRLRYPPHGGSVADYIAWGREVAGVTRVYVDPVTPENGRVSVGLWFLKDDTYDDGIPLLADVTLMRDYIASVKPAGARVDIDAPRPLQIPVTIGGLVPNSLDVQAAIRAELADLFRREMAVSMISAPATVWRSKLWEAVSIATGESHHTLTAPAADVSVPVGSIAVLDSVTFA